MHRAIACSLRTEKVKNFLGVIFTFRVLIFSSNSIGDSLSLLQDDNSNLGGDDPVGWFGCASR